MHAVLCADRVETEQSRAERAKGGERRTTIKNSRYPQREREEEAEKTKAIEIMIYFAMQNKRVWGLGWGFLK